MSAAKKYDDLCAFGGPAFPFNLVEKSTAGGAPVETVYSPGMTLRDYFAAKFMAAMALTTFGSARKQAKSPHEAGETLAMVSYKMADAMLAERAK